MSCQVPLPESLPEAEGLGPPPCSADSPEKCEEHEESLSVFCLDDLEPVCKQCAAVSHAGHRVYLLTEAAADCKEELSTLMNGLREKMIHLENVTQTCEHASTHNQAEAKLAELWMKEEFESLHQFLRGEEEVRILELRREEEEKRIDTEERMDRLDEMIKCVEDKIQLIEEELDAGESGADFLQRHQDTVKSAPMGHREPVSVCRPLIDVAKHLGNLQYAVWEKMKHIAPYTPVTMDPRTAAQSLRVSPGLNSIQPAAGPSQELIMDGFVPVPANPERFHPYSCILARQGFDSGVHRWEIDVGDSENWTLGVAAASVPRREEFEACPEAGLWCICLRNGEYQALTTPSQILHFDESCHLSRIRLKLEWDQGVLEFTNADNDAHLFTFRHRFAERVYPYFESVSVCGGLSVLAQRVSINVGSDDIPVEDTVTDVEDQMMMKSKSSSEGDIITAGSINKMSECGHVAEDKNSAMCCAREEKKTQRSTTKEKPMKTKPTKRVKPSNSKATVKKPSSKASFSVAYHVSLNKSLNCINKEPGNPKQIQVDYSDNLNHSACDE